MKLAKLVVSVGLVAAVCGAAPGCSSDDGRKPAPPSCLPGCTGARDYDAVSYDLRARFDWDAQLLTAAEDVAVAPGAGGLVVELDSAVTVTGVFADSQDLAFAASPANHTLTVDLTPLGDAAPAVFTIAYTATPSGSLIPTASRDDDPVTSRVVFTDSEPDRALNWLVTKLDPSDRALWSVRLAVDPDEDVIANGARVSDEVVDGKRVVGYALDKPIPPYLMAFAAGQLDHSDRMAGAVPLSVWYRRGLVLDPDATLDAVADAMTTFDTLIMPYPWDSYSVVLLPYGGGMENATITFNNETSGQGTVGFVLNAHELAHHWFGDWVTMNTYDDVWFKEGMATVLESEAERARRDREARGRMWGIDYAYNPEDAIVDDSLHGLDKYTSGPYQRAGWLITQIRATVGETAFWDGLRGLLAAHALDSATGEQFIRSFQPALSEANVQQLLASLPSHAMPEISATTAPSGADTSVMLSLSDPAGTMIAPIDVAVIDASGVAVTQQLAPGAPLTLVVPAGGYLAPDERDVHPAWSSNFGAQINLTLLAPPADAASEVLAAFESRSAAQQERVSAGELSISDPSQFAAFRASLDSEVAQDAATLSACRQALSTGDPNWLVAAEPALEAPARPQFDPSYGVCRTSYPTQTLEAELASSLAGATPASLARVEYLLSFDYGDDTIAAIGAVVTSAPSLELRDEALERLWYQAAGYPLYSPISNATLPAWDALAEGELVPTMSETRFYSAIELIVALNDTAAVPLIAPLLHQVALSSRAQVYGVCAAHALTGTGSAAWAAFQTATMPWNTLDPAAAAVLQNPAGCGGVARRERAHSAIRPREGKARR